jgi:hypothetical protein
MAAHGSLPSRRISGRKIGVSMMISTMALMNNPATRIKKTISTIEFEVVHLEGRARDHLGNALQSDAVAGHRPTWAKIG